MAYYLGKGLDRPVDRDVFDLFRRRREPFDREEERRYIPPEEKIVKPPPVPPVTPTEETVAETPPENYADELLRSMFGAGFEDIMRGRGTRQTESMYDMLAREGLLGTGAAKGIGQEQAWETERGITDLLRGIEQVRYEREQDAINRLLSLFFNLMGGWQ